MNLSHEKISLNIFSGSESDHNSTFIVFFPIVRIHTYLFGCEISLLSHNKIFLFIKTINSLSTPTT